MLIHKGFGSWNGEMHVSYSESTIFETCHFRSAFDVCVCQKLVLQAALSPVVLMSNFQVPPTSAL